MNNNNHNNNNNSSITLCSTGDDHDKKKLTKKRIKKRQRSRISLAQRIGLVSWASSSSSSSSSSSQQQQKSSLSSSSKQQQEKPKLQCQHLLMDILLGLAFGMAAFNMLVLYLPLERIHNDGSIDSNNDNKRQPSQTFANAASSFSQMMSIMNSVHLPPPEQRQIHFIFGLWDNEEEEEEEETKSKPQSDSKMSTEFQQNLKLYEQNNPEWKIVKWFSKQEIERQVQTWTKSSSSSKRRFSIQNAWKVAKPVQRADLFRYLLLWEQGGWYFDLDTTTVAHNRVQRLMQAVQLDPRRHTAALFWERGPLAESEQYESQFSEFRHGRPEYKYRLANYALWSTPKSCILKCAIQLATYRIIKIDQENLEDLEYERIPAVLYSTGPDVVTECAFGVRDKYFANTTMAKKQDEELVRRTHLTTENVLVVDPGPNLVNGNTFSWKNEKAA